MAESSSSGAEQSASRRKKSKIYLHFEPSGQPQDALTAPYSLDVGSEADVSGVVDDFICRVCSKHQTLRNAKFALATETGRKVSFSGLSDEVEDAQDFFLVVVPGAKRGASSSGATASTPAPHVAPAPAAGAVPSEAEIRDVEALIAKRSCKKARELLERWMPSFRSKSTSKEELCCLRALMQIFVSAKKFSEAVTLGQYAVKKYRSVGIQLFQLLAQAYAGKEDYDEAVQCMDVALGLWSSSTARNALPSALRSDKFYLDLVAYTAQCLFDAGQHQEAAQKVNEVMGTPGAGDHLGIVTAYARFALQYNKLEDALNAVLKVIVGMGTKDIQSQPKDSRKLLADFFSAKGAIDLFHSKIPATSQGTGEIYGYLGSTVKDFSQFDAALRLYQLSLTADPSNASFALNLSHIYEMKADFAGALREILAFCSRNPSLSVNKLSCAEFASAIREEATAAEIARSCQVQWVQTEGASASGGGEDGYAAVTVASGATGMVQHPGSVAFTPKELDLLALFAAAVKLLYLLDKRVFLPAAIFKVETVRRLSQARLHETSVRNELAYYNDVAQIVCCYYAQPEVKEQTHFLSASASTDAVARPMYVLGDSHCLSPAWSEIHLRGEKRTLVPKLVTGVKQWHLREESVFHPKHAFLNQVASLPDRADVILQVGEIDCREGLLFAVEKDYYANLVQAMQATIAVFVKAIQQLRKKKKFTLWIHPVAPVLNETRPIVLLFNTHFRQAVERLGDANVKWLDFVEQLLDSNGNDNLQLREEFRHDGTHLHPNYVSVLEKALNAQA